MASRISELRHSIAEDLPPTQFAGVFPKGHVTILASAPGTGKTWFVIKTAMDYSIGGNIFMGLASNEPKRKSVIMCGESGLNILTERRAKIATHYDPDYISIYTLQDLADAEVEICLDSHDGPDNLKKIIQGEEAQICFIDSLIAFRSEDENVQQTTSRVFQRLITIAKRTNCAIVITHHTRKRKRGDKGDPTQDDIIGSSAIIRLASTAFTLSVDEESGLTKLSCVKSWWAKPEPIMYRLENRQDGTVRFFRPMLQSTEEQEKAIIQYLMGYDKGDFVRKSVIEDAINVTSEAVDGVFATWEHFNWAMTGRDEEGYYGVTITQ